MPRKKKPEQDLPDGIYPNKYRKKCTDRSCDVLVEPGEGFIQRVNDGAVSWLTWCKDHVPVTQQAANAFDPVDPVRRLFGSRRLAEAD